MVTTDSMAGAKAGIKKWPNAFNAADAMAAKQTKKRKRKHLARQSDGQIEGGRVRRLKSPRRQGHDQRRGQNPQPHQRQQKEPQRREQGLKKIPGFPGFVFGQMLGKNRNKRGGQAALAQHPSKQVGQSERRM
jgi:hypothetical protein